MGAPARARQAGILESQTSFGSKLFARKDIRKIQEQEAKGSGLRRVLTAYQLVMLGIGGIIGAGIFSLTGAAAAHYAGPAIVYSFIISGILCALAGVCYAEMASMVPIAGSAYSYSYATLGELIAWIIGWDLCLEYGFGAITVSTAWSGYLLSLFKNTFGIHFPDIVMRFTKGPWEEVVLGDGTKVMGFWNVPATFVATLVSMVLYRGIQESSRINNIIVFVKVAIVLSFIALGWGVIDSLNLVGNPGVRGLASLIPPPSEILRHGTATMSYGWPGVVTGAAVVFFAYIGFDAISTCAQECKNPQKDLPIGMLGSLVICTILYVLVALVLTGVVPYQQLGVPDPVAVGIDRIVELRQWSSEGRFTITFLVKMGALCGLTSVILVLLLGQTRIFYSMAKDGLLPWFDKTHPKYQSPYIATVVTGAFVAIGAGLFPITLVGELTSIGTLLAFVLVCLGVIVLRIKQPELHRPFKVPMYKVVAPLGAISCLWVMTGLPMDTWIRLFVWLAIGFVIYFTYSVKNSRLRNQSKSY